MDTDYTLSFSWTEHNSWRFATIFHVKEVGRKPVSFCLFSTALSIDEVRIVITFFSQFDYNSFFSVKSQYNK
jgi:hypothetical protein